MKSETLSTWDLIAIETAIKSLIDSGKVDVFSGLRLLDKLNEADKIRLIYKS
jgi:hypothetical protein